MSGKNGRNAGIEEKLNSILKAIDKLTERMSSLETKIETFENQLMTVDCKYSEKCSKLEAEISALDLNVTQIGSLATEIEATITAKFDDINEKQEMNETRQEMLLQKIANLERDNVMRESYDKRLNILVHGLKESENETKRQTKKTLETFLWDGLELDPDAIKLVDVHRLPQRPLKKAGNLKTRPIIFKVSTFSKKTLSTKTCPNSKITTTTGHRLFLSLNIYQSYFSSKNSF